MSGFLTNGLPMVPQVGPDMLVPVDTDFQQGANPASVAASALQVAGVLGECLLNGQTSTAAAATSNTLGGTVTTEALATAPGANYTFTLTNSLINAAYIASGRTPEAAIYSGSNTGGTIPPGTMSAMMKLISITVNSGNVVFVWRNAGMTNLNGTMNIVWHL
jgi:hypothetical protein